MCFYLLSNIHQRLVQPCQSTLYLHRHNFSPPLNFPSSILRVITFNPSVDSNEHSHHYFTPLPSHLDTWREISVFHLYSSWKTMYWERIANFEQHLQDSICLNYPDLLFSEHFIEDTSISQFWSISEAFPDTIKILHYQLRLVGNFGLHGWIPWLKRTGGALCSSANSKLKIEFIFFCGVQNFHSLGITCTKNYCIQRTDLNRI